MSRRELHEIGLKFGSVTNPPHGYGTQYIQRGTKIASWKTDCKMTPGVQKPLCVISSELHAPEAASHHNRLPKEGARY
ncbi:unnamed protein product [Nezara viridula]|uniref:Uncharacterized protein n=1 Tax=Nezara viridula TaxID=85310 RepID=A0A9P0H0J0_NEZVI|nr:unnamed protein product [Nezara viridula]